jgi:hypothetical protein
MWGKLRRDFGGNFWLFVSHFGGLGVGEFGKLFGEKRQRKLGNF